MTTHKHIENPDVILIGSGVMSANLGALLKRLDPRLTIQLYEVTDGLAQESRTRLTMISLIPRLAYGSMGRRGMGRRPPQRRRR